MAGRNRVEDDLTAENTFGKTLQIDVGERFTISVSNTFVATVTLQRRLDGVAWRDVESYTVPTEKDGLAAEGQEIRLGIKSGNFTSGTATCRIGKG